MGYVVRHQWPNREQGRCLENAHQVRADFLQRPNRIGVEFGQEPVGLAARDQNEVRKLLQLTVYVFEGIRLNLFVSNILLYVEHARSPFGCAEQDLNPADVEGSALSNTPAGKWGDWAYGAHAASSLYLV